MNSNISLRFVDFYSLGGRIGRIYFFLGLALIIILISTLHYLFFPFVMETKNINYIFGFKVSLQFLNLTLLTPFFVKRFHDLNSSGFWVLFFWVILPFSLEAADLVRTYIGIHINPFNKMVIFIELIGILMFLVLLLKRGNPEGNQWGNPNKKIQPDAAKAAPLI